MAKNILIFSDGTGQVGGITFDENRTNIYKLYRATRCGPDSPINPTEQVAFYDPGLGSPVEGGFIFANAARRFYNLASQATGLGLTTNIIDCYAALIRLYEDGDRIFLFGFSRGAYTVRSLAGVLAKCGIPRSMPDGKPLHLDMEGSTKLATSAVKNVYQFYPSKPRTKEPESYQNFMLDTRDLIAKRFREEHGCSHPTDPSRPNVDPYFIGVFDTVAALARVGAVLGLSFFVIAGLLLLSAAISAVSYLPFERAPGWLQWLGYLTFSHVLTFLLAMTGFAAVIAFFENYVKFDFRVYGRNWIKKLATIHIAPPKHKFTDTNLNPNIQYAKHAISIDENRKDFARVSWTPTGPRAGTRDSAKNIYFEQVWFAGVHADIGGGYLENESRLSDIALAWMVAAASIIPNGIITDSSPLHLFGDPTGPQHDECKAGWWQRGIREPTNNATMHWSVYQRFKAPSVLHYDVREPYRPVNLRNHIDFAHYYTNTPAPTEIGAIADNIEYKWRNKLTAVTPKAAGSQSVST